MERRNTVQKDLVRNAVLTMKRHVTAEEVYEYVRQEHHGIGKGTVYRNLGILSEEEVSVASRFQMGRIVSISHCEITTMGAACAAERCSM